MARKELIDYIKNTHELGYTIEEIQSSLLNQGFSQAELKEAITALNVGNTNTPNRSINNINNEITLNPEKSKEFRTNTDEPNMGFLEKLKLIIIKPGQFYEKIESETTYKPIVIYHAILLFIVYMIQLTLTTIIEYTISEGFAIFSLIVTIILSVVTLPLLLVVVIIVASVVTGLYYISSRLLNVDCSFQKIFKLVVYSSTPGFLISGLNPLSEYYDFMFYVSIHGIEINPFVLWSVILMVIGISQTSNVSKKKAILLVILPGLLILMLSILIALVISQIT